MAKYQEYRNPITGKVTSTGENPYKQVTTQYGNRAQGVRQAANARKRLMKLRRQSGSRFTPEQVAALQGLSQQLGGSGEVTGDTTGKMGDYKATPEDQAAVKAQKERFDKMRAEGKNPGYNLGLSENERAFNQSVRKSVGSTRNRIGKLRELLAGAGDNQADRIRNRIERQKTRRDNFRAQLFTPTGTNAPKPPARPGMKRPKPKGGNTGGVAP